MSVRRIATAALALLAGLCLRLDTPADAHLLHQLTDGEEVVVGTAGVFAGTVTGTGKVRYTREVAWGRLYIRIDKIVGKNPLRLSPGQTVSTEVMVLDGEFEDRFDGIKLTPAFADIHHGQVRFEFLPGTSSDDELHAALAGKQFYFLIKPQLDDEAGTPVTQIYPMWNGGWIRACWTHRGTCADQQPPRVPGLAQDVYDCAARVIARQPGVLDAQNGQDFRFTFDLGGTPTRMVARTYYRNGGPYLIGAPQLVSGEGFHQTFEFLRDKDGNRIEGRTRDDNPLKTAIPQLARECGILYAGDGLGAP